MVAGAGYGCAMRAPTGCGRRWYVQRSGAARAAIKAAPTPRFLFSRRGGLYGRPEAVALRQGSMVPPRRGRCPHRPASPRVRGSPPSAPFPAPVVGADCISARNPVRYLPGPGGCGSRTRTRHARPYGGCGRRWCVRRSGAARAAMKAAPTPRFSFSRRGGLYGRLRLSKNLAENVCDRAAGEV